MVKLRLNLCKARELYLYASIAATDGWEAALEILGESFDVVMSEEQKKKLESIRKKKQGDEDKPAKTSHAVSHPTISPGIQDALLLARLLQAQSSGSSSNMQQAQVQQPNQHLLGLAGPNRKRGPGRFINKAGSQCFKCEGFGHWADDDACPLNILAKKKMPELEQLLFLLGVGRSSVVGLPANGEFLQRREGARVPDQEAVQGHQH